MCDDLQDIALISDKQNYQNNWPNYLISVILSESPSSHHRKKASPIMSHLTSGTYVAPNVEALLLDGGGEHNQQRHRPVLRPGLRADRAQAKSQLQLLLHPLDHPPRNRGNNKLDLAVQKLNQVVKITKKL